VIDPCTPRGYRWSVEEGQHHAVSISTGTHSPVSSILSQGNFSECRSAAYSLLQKDHGTKWPQSFSMHRERDPATETERETETERQRDRERDRDRETERQRERNFLVKRLLGQLIFLLPVCMEICHGIWEFCGLGSRCLHISKMCNRKCFCSRATREFLCNWELLLHIWGLSFCSIPFHLIHELHRQVVSDTTFYFDIVAAQFILQTEQIEYTDKISRQLIHS
jgi:hypothetical protein